VGLGGGGVRIIMATRFELAHASSTAVCPAPRGLIPHTMHANEDNRGPNGKQRCPIHFPTQSKTSHLLAQATTSNLLTQATTSISSTLQTVKPPPYLAPRTTFAPPYISSLRSSSHLISPFPLSSSTYSILYADKQERYDAPVPNQPPNVERAQEP
jgi:hypothetical protein